MITENPAGRHWNAAPLCEFRWPSVASLATRALLALCVCGVAWPALAQTPNRLALCTLSDSEGRNTLSDLEEDVAEALEIEDDDVEIAFVVVYSLHNDNNGQPVGEASWTGPVLCTAPDIAELDEDDATGADEPIPPDEEETVDILDSAEAFLLRYRLNDESEDVETRFCHTTNANVDCYPIQQVDE